MGLGGKLYQGDQWWPQYAQSVVDGTDPPPIEHDQQEEVDLFNLLMPGSAVLSRKGQWAQRIAAATEAGEPLYVTPEELHELRGLSDIEQHAIRYLLILKGGTTLADAQVQVRVR